MQNVCRCNNVVCQVSQKFTMLSVNSHPRLKKLGNYYCNACYRRAATSPEWICHSIPVTTFSLPSLTLRARNFPVMSDSRLADYREKNSGRGILTLPLSDHLPTRQIFFKMWSDLQTLPWQIFFCKHDVTLSSSHTYWIKLWHVCTNGTVRTLEKVGRV